MWLLWLQWADSPTTVGVDVQGKDKYFGSDILAKRKTLIGRKSLVPLNLSERESRFIGDVMRAWYVTNRFRVHGWGRGRGSAQVHVISLKLSC